VLIYSLVSGLSAWGRPAILLVNQTEDHRYDRALRSSIRTFQDRTHIQLGIVLTDRLPPMTTIMAELLHFEMYWLEAAAPLYEKFLELEPEHHEIRWRLIDIYLNTTDVDGQERQYLELLKRKSEDPLLRHLYYNWFLPMYSASSDYTQPTQDFVKAVATMGHPTAMPS
jgi:hypothetical protein